MVRTLSIPGISILALCACFVTTPLWAQDVHSLTVQQLVQRLRASSAQIQSASLQRDLAVTGIERAQSQFQPQVNAAISNGYNSQQNTFEEKLARKDQPDYWRKGADTTLGVSQLLGTGAKLEAKLGVSRFDSNISRLQTLQDPTVRPPGSRDHRSQWSLNLTQPLARDAGTKVTQARSEVARLDAEASAKDLLRTQTTSLAEGLVAYQELALAGERSRVARAKIAMGERLLSDAQALLAQGRLPPADVWEVENALARFRAELSMARQGEREKGNRLKSLLMVSASEQPGLWHAADALPAAGVAPLPQQALATALERRPDLQRLRLVSQREDVQLMYAQNQALPRVDLVTSYGRGDLALAVRDSLVAMRSPTWNVGLVAQLPLGPNLQAQADIAAAQVRQQDSDLKRKSLEVEIANEVDTALALYHSAQERLQHWREIAQREAQAMELERRRLQAGRSGMRDVLNREERALNAELALAEQHAALAQAQVVLSSAQGTLEGQWP